MKPSSISLFLAAVYTTTSNSFIVSPYRLPSPIFSRLFNDISTSPVESSSSTYYQVKVNNLPSDIKKESLEKIIRERNTEYTQIKLMQNKKVFAFIDYNTKEAAESAAVALEGIRINGKTWKVSIMLDILLYCIAI
jgi:RNA recognition motif-containing protein